MFAALASLGARYSTDARARQQNKNGTRSADAIKSTEVLCGDEFGPSTGELLLLFCQLLRKVYNLDVFSQAK